MKASLEQLLPIATLYLFLPHRSAFQTPSQEDFQSRTRNSVAHRSIAPKSQKWNQLAQLFLFT